MATRGRLLIADDEPLALQTLGRLLAAEGYEVALARDGSDALRQAMEAPPDVLIADLRMPGLDGQALLQRVRSEIPGTPVVIMSAHGSIRSAVDALRAGAEDYLTKPVNYQELTSLIERLVAAGHGPGEALEGVVGASPPMKEIARVARQVASSPSSILITGESGTGKEVIARAIHALGPRAGAPFVKVSCAALPETLLESELFGHERGAFTGALARRAGRFELADGGTVFLDEVGDIPPAMQVKLLRFLQEKQFERIGANRTRTVDVRVIAATHRDLEQLVREKAFRDDLYYRLKVIELHVPPLRERPEDIPLLVRHFVQAAAAANGRHVTGVTDATLAAMMASPWPGNVRELENAIERAVVLSRGRLLEPGLFPSLAAPARAGTRGPAIPGSSLEEIEKEAILRTLEAVGGSSTRAAAILRISPRTIQYKRKQYLEEPPRPRDLRQPS